MSRPKAAAALARSDPVSASQFSADRRGHAPVVSGPGAQGTAPPAPRMREGGIRFEAHEQRSVSAPSAGFEGPVNAEGDAPDSTGHHCASVSAK